MNNSQQASDGHETPKSYRPRYKTNAAPSQKGKGSSSKDTTPIGTKLPTAVDFLKGPSKTQTRNQSTHNLEVVDAEKASSLSIGSKGKPHPAFSRKSRSRPGSSRNLAKRGSLLSKQGGGNSQINFGNKAREESIDSSDTMVSFFEI